MALISGLRYRFGIATVLGCWIVIALGGGRLVTAQTIAGAAKPIEGNRWALLIGVDDYSEIRKLRFAGSDQRALAEQLVAAGFPQDQVFLLHDKATEKKYLPFRENIDKQLDIVLGLAEPDDLVIVSFSGHGVQFDGKSYLCPVDARVDKLAATLIPIDDVYQRLSKCKASLKLLVVDACRNDVLPEGRRSVVVSGSLGEFNLPKEKPPAGILLLASCGAGQTSMEDEAFGHGVFMHFLLEGLRGQAANTDGFVSLARLYDYSSLETKKYVARKFNDFQTPALRGEIDGPFMICAAAKSGTPNGSAPLQTGKSFDERFAAAFDGLLSRSVQGEPVHVAVCFGGPCRDDDLVQLQNLPAGIRITGISLGPFVGPQPGAEPAWLTSQRGLIEKSKMKTGSSVEIVNDVRRCLDVAAVDAVLLVGFLDSETPALDLGLGKSLNSIDMLERVTTWSLQAGKDAYVQAAREDRATWTPKLQTANNDENPVEAEKKYSRITYLGNGKSEGLAEFLVAVRSRAVPARSFHRLAGGAN